HPRGEKALPRLSRLFGRLPPQISRSRSRPTLEPVGSLLPRDIGQSGGISQDRDRAGPDSGDSLAVVTIQACLSRQPAPLPATPSQFASLSPQLRQTALLLCLLPLVPNHEPDCRRSRTPNSR